MFLELWHKKKLKNFNHSWLQIISLETFTQKVPTCLNHFISHRNKNSWHLFHKIYAITRHKGPWFELWTTEKFIQSLTLHNHKYFVYLDTDLWDVHEQIHCCCCCCFIQTHTHTKKMWWKSNHDDNFIFFHVSKMKRAPLSTQAQSFYNVSGNGKFDLFVTTC